MSDDWLLRLAVEVVLLAVRDARRGDAAAAAWLTSEGAAFILEGLNIEPVALLAALALGT